MKGYKVIVGLVALAFAAGIFGGYRIWGTAEKGKTDIPGLMQQLKEEVDRIESRNRELTESLEASREKISTAEAIRKENQDLKGQLQDALKEKQVTESATIDDLKGRIQSLEGENRDLSDRLRKSQQENEEKESLLKEARGELSAAGEKAVQGEKLREVTDELNARISALENENRELKSVIDNISDLTRVKETPGR